MCTYCSTNKYRKIYENHIGSIPKEANGRTYEIHHIDGNHYNNDPSNLQAVTIQEHYNVHYAQKDWYACLKIGAKMKLSPDELSELAKKNAQKKVENGTHPFLNKETARKNNQKRVENGTHHFLSRPDGTNISTDRIAAGTHNWLDGEKTRQQNLKRINDGIHQFLGDKNPAKIASKNGTHHFFGDNHPAKIKCSCIWCKKETKFTALIQFHSYEKCNENSNPPV